MPISPVRSLFDRLERVKALERELERRGCDPRTLLLHAELLRELGETIELTELPDLRHVGTVAWRAGR